MVMGGRVMFPLGIVFPLSTTEPASFEFLGRFCAEAPFKLSAKHFQVGIVSSTGKFAWRKPDADIAANVTSSASVAAKRTPQSTAPSAVARALAEAQSWVARVSG